MVVDLSKCILLACARESLWTMVCLASSRQPVLKCLFHLV